MLSVLPFDAADIAWNRLVSLVCVVVLVMWHVDVAPSATPAGARMAMGTTSAATSASATNGRCGLLMRGMSTSRRLSPLVGDGERNGLSEVPRVAYLGSTDV